MFKKKRTGFLIIALILFSGLTLFAKKADSIKQLPNNTMRLQKLEVLNRLMDASLYNNLDSACYYAALLEKESKQNHSIHYRTLALRGLGICNFYKNEYSKAEDYILKAVALQKENRDTSGLANSYKVLTGIYWETERYDKSVAISFEALKLYEATGDIKGIVSSYNNIGLLYKRLDEPDKALLFFNKAVKTALSNKLCYNLGNLYNNTGLVYKNLKKYTLSVNFYRKALKEYKKDSLLGGIATGYLNLGNLFAYHLNKPDSAFYYYNMALQLSKNTDYTHQTDIYSGLAYLYSQSGHTEKSIEVLKKALALAQAYKDVDIQRDIHYELYKAFKNKGSSKKALVHLEQYTQIQDTLSLEKAKVAIANLESKFENEKNKIIIKQMQERQHAEKRIRLLLLTGIILLLISLALTAYGFNLSKKKSKLRRALLETEKEQLENALQFKSRQLTSQALMMMKKNQLLNDINNALSGIKALPDEEKQKLRHIQKQLKKGIRSEEDWKLFQHYFEEVNPAFFRKLLDINSRITPSELKLAALVKLNFSIKETASLLNISPDSVKTTRSVLRKKLKLQKGNNIYDFLNNC